MPKAVRIRFLQRQVRILERNRRLERPCIFCGAAGKDDLQYYGTDCPATDSRAFGFQVLGPDQSLNFLFLFGRRGGESQQQRQTRGLFLADFWRQLDGANKGGTPLWCLSG